MNEIITIDENIKSMIYEIRGKYVMLDSDLAKLYECKNGTKEINQAVKNNNEKFPERFSWILTNEEYDYLRSKILTTNNNYNKKRYNPRVFTEQGVSMLSTILKSKKAIKTSIAIMDAFVEMKNYLINSNFIEQKHINSLVFEHDIDIKMIKEYLPRFKTFSNQIFYEGQIYDAYSLLLDIFNDSNKSIIIIDNYISKELLDILSKTNKNIIIYTKSIDNNLITKYKSQYKNISVEINNNFHDRFIIIDNKILYHSGASFKDLGKKCFAINKISDNTIIQNLINNL